MATQRIARLFNRITGRPSATTALSDPSRRKAAQDNTKLSLEGLEERLLPVVGPAQVLAPAQIAAVGYLSTSFPGGLQSSCTATLISQTKVLTAAHCVDTVLPTQTGGAFRARANAVTFSVGGPSGPAYQASGYFTSGGWNPTNNPIDSPHDFAIVTLARPVYGVQPYNLWLKTPQVGTTVYIVGFGQYTDGYGNVRDPAAQNGDLHKRMGTTTIDYVGAGRVFWRYDRGEASTGHGDSGGPQIACDSRGCGIISVTSGGYDFGRSVTGNPAPVPSSNTWAWNTRVDFWGRTICEAVANQNAGCSSIRSTFSSSARSFASNGAASFGAMRSGQSMMDFSTPALADITRSDGRHEEQGDLNAKLHSREVNGTGLQRGGNVDPSAYLVRSSTRAVDTALEHESVQEIQLDQLVSELDD
jgi:hypothetical protein